MPYTFANNARAITYGASDMYPIRSLKQCLKDLRQVKFTYQSSRDKGQAALDALMDAGISGFEMFDNQRFPDGLTAVFFSSCDINLAAALSRVRTALAYRETNQAKDTEVHLVASGSKTKADDTKDQVGFKGQSSQDAFKSYYSAVEELGSVLCSGGINRQRFEADTIATWA